MKCKWSTLRAFWLSKHSTLHSLTSPQFLNLNVNSFIFPLFLCRRHTETTLSSSGDGSLAVTRSTGYAACKYFVCPKPRMGVRMSQCSRLKVILLTWCFNFKACFSVSHFHHLFHSLIYLFPQLQTIFRPFLSQKCISRRSKSTSSQRRLLFTTLSVISLYKSLFPWVFQLWASVSRSFTVAWWEWNNIKIFSLIKSPSFLYTILHPL